MADKGTDVRAEVVVGWWSALSAIRDASDAELNDLDLGGAR